MGNGDPPKWWIMHFQVRDELPDVSVYAAVPQKPAHIVFEVHVYVLGCRIRARPS
jgi:hypothetical protein